MFNRLRSNVTRLEPAQNRRSDLEAQVIEKLRTIHDPEIPVNIYDLGLIYDIETDDDKKVKIVMTLTAPNCPVADTLPNEIRDKVAALEGVTDVDINLVFDPPWNQSMMSEEALLELGML